MPKPHEPKRGVVLHLHRKDVKTLAAALHDAISDREAYREAYTPRWSEPDGQARKILRETRQLIVRYEKLRERLVKWLNETKT